MLPYNTELLAIDQKVANFMEGAWRVGRISNLTHSRRKWIEYKDMPWVRSYKKSVKGLVPSEFAHPFNEGDYGSHWFFVREEWEGWVSIDDVPADAAATAIA